MGIRGKTLIVLLAVLIVLLGGILPFGVLQYAGIRDRSIEGMVRSYESVLGDALSAKEDVWLTNALQIVSVLSTRSPAVPICFP